MRPYKCIAVPPFDGKPTWHGLYYKNGRWHEVCNQNDLPIAYASAKAAIDGAKYEAEKQT